MNQKLPVSRLAEMLAAKCGVDIESAQAFVKAFFDLVARELVDGKSVHVKGIGTFSHNVTDADSPVLFTPDASLADAVNAPFALFEPETLPAEVTEAKLAEIDNTSTEEEQEPEEGTIPSAESAVPLSSAELSVPQAELEEAPADEEPAKPEAPLASAEPSVPQVKLEDIEEVPEEYVEAPVTRRDGTGLGFGWGLVVGIFVGLALGAAGTYFAIDYLFPAPAVEAEEVIVSEPEPEVMPFPETVDTVVSTEAPVDSAELSVPKSQPDEAAVAPVAELPEPKPETVTDVVKAGYLMPEMARKHYGARAFWAYIYEENKAKIGNPNMLRPGMKLVIPPASKYGIDSKNPKSLEAANRKATQILAKYPN